MSKDKRPKKFVALCNHRDRLLDEIGRLPVLKKESHVYTKQDKKIIRSYHSQLSKVFRKYRRMMWSRPKRWSDRLILKYLCWYQYLYTAEKLIQAMGGHQASITRYLISEYPISVKRLHRMRLLPRLFGIRRIPSEFIRLLRLRATHRYKKLLDDYHNPNGSIRGM